MKRMLFLCLLAGCGGNQEPSTQVTEKSIITPSGWYDFKVTEVDLNGRQYAVAHNQHGGIAICPVSCPSVTVCITNCIPKATVGTTIETP